MTPQWEPCSEQYVRPWIGGKAGPRRLPIGRGADRNGPRLGNTGALPQRSLQEVDRFHGFCIHSLH